MMQADGRFGGWRIKVDVENGMKGFRDVTLLSEWGWEGREVGRGGDVWGARGWGGGG